MIGLILFILLKLAPPVFFSIVSSLERYTKYGKHGYGFQYDEYGAYDYEYYVWNGNGYGDDGDV
jgi:hypothetical protein